jgi:hypothetical protein
VTVITSPEKDEARPESIFQCRVSLKGMIPPIRRKFQVVGDTTLYRLHLTLQTVMGWQNKHLYRFIIDGVDYSEPPPDIAWPPVQDPHRVTLDQVVPEEDSRFIYIYDYKADWQHVIKVDRRLAPKPDMHYPVCLSGQRACPPEDTNGIFEYMQLLDIFQDPDHDEHTTLINLWGTDFDPDTFDLEQVNQALRQQSINH